MTTRVIAGRAGVNQAPGALPLPQRPGLLRAAAYVAMSAVFEPATVRLVETGDPLAGLRGAIEAVAEIDPRTPETRAAIATHDRPGQPRAGRR